MKIFRLEAENVKRLKAVSITPDGNLVEITGRNGQGKSSVLDAIWWALSGTKPIQAVPIRKGQDEARIRLDLGEIRVTRTFKKRDGAEFTTAVVVENADGARFARPQELLDKLLGQLSFDPLAFTRMDGRQQLDAMKRFVPGFDFAGTEKANKDDFAGRTEVNRSAKALRAQADGITVPSGTPEARIDTAALVAEMEQAGEHNTDIERRRGRREQAERAIEAYAETAAGSRNRAAALRKEADEAEARADRDDAEAGRIRASLAEASALPDPIDTSALRQRIAAAGETNAAVARREERDRIDARAKEAEAKAAALTKAIEGRVAGMRSAIAQADLPVPGIAFGDDEILLNGVPFDQASSAEQLRTSVAIAMAANPKLRVIRVQDGSLLDAEAMAILGEMADAADCQVWVECVQSGRSTAIVIEDGEVLGATATPIAAE
ncbi:AAA family ATPase [Methylobacterium haplocladii]|uniref:Rad50/SbcC-type AAA domain-containing protein n=1 Tax=Methylobacterium haplocladii TaxID=1176176 RepID=A0A512ISC3_9HYPH|nr:AAA family ATPase [Methylobacterium haplocladii]GEP00576.1 hypothetical protein MHA02_29630 [Methylobacterium haplocladii]GJD85491.1 DNA replication and repair protein RecF [Methylobacterium haplocladii]GLS57724.1 hypothetical protein GCM10007887_03800 [Methylobacterium haplocladii]